MGNVYYCFFPGPQGLTREWLQGKRLPVAGSDTVVGRRITALVGGNLVQKTGSRKAGFLRDHRAGLNQPGLSKGGRFSISGKSVLGGSGRHWERWTEAG